MSNTTRGFSLIELLMALLITAALSAMMFQLFHQNERVMRDQTLITEMQQTARIVASQIADEVRMAGQGVPIYASSFDTAASEAIAAILPSSTASRIDFRSSLSNVETAATSPGPIDVELGVSRPFYVADGSLFPNGKFVYVSGPSTSSAWSWVRAELTNAGSAALTLVPRETGAGGTIIHFNAPPIIFLEEAVSIYLSGTSVRRATANDMANPANPTWSAANEIGKNFTALNFTYYDMMGNVVTTASLANRQSVARVDINLTVETASALADGSRPTYSLALRTIPRNLRLRPAN